MFKMMTILAAAATVAIAVPALAQGDLTVRGSKVDADTIRVPYGDLQLANADDAATLRTRVHGAIRRGCGNLYGSAMIDQEWTCRDVAWNAAAPQLAQALASAESGRTFAGNTLVLRFARR